MNFVYYLHDVSSQNEAEDILLYFYRRFNIVPSDKIFEIIHGDLDNQVVLTIDDGWKSTYDYFFPVCMKYNIPITIFVSPYMAKSGENFWFYNLQYCNHKKIKNHLIREGYFKDEILNYPIDLVLKEMCIDDVYDILQKYMEQKPIRGFCNELEILEMSKSGLVTIGAHTNLHPILANENFDRSKYEIGSSISQLEELLQKKVTTFAYPNGMYGYDFTEREMNFCQEYGIQMAFSVDCGVLEAEMHTAAIPRCGSLNRIKLGRLGMRLPSIYNQAGKRDKIRNYKNF